MAHLTKGQKDASPSSGLSTLQHLDGRLKLATICSISSLIGAFAGKVSGVPPASYQVPCAEVGGQRTWKSECGMGNGEIFDFGF